MANRVGVFEKAEPGIESETSNLGETSRFSYENDPGKALQPMKVGTRRLLIPVLIGLVSACGRPALPNDDATTSTTATNTTASTTTAADQTEEDEPMAEELAIADLAQRLDVDPQAIYVVSSEQVTWKDASIGCSQPDVMYAQVLTEGKRIILDYDGQLYHYHAAADSAPFLCEDPDSMGFVSPSSNQTQASTTTSTSTTLITSPTLTIPAGSSVADSVVKAARVMLGELLDSDPDSFLLV
ncbi:MAG TPA: hypothetical protein VE569_00425, partial [Acidimicrobiia bacterium]|nr:hypothetical protein [Acidimicrobiia bacterium]